MTLRKLIPDAPPGLVVKMNKDGTARVYVQAPKDRPPSVPATTPLPFKNRTGKLDAAELAAIRRDGWAFWAEYEQIKKAYADPSLAKLTWAGLADGWLASSLVKALADYTQFNYRYWCGRVVKDLDGRPGYEPDRVTNSRVDTYLQNLRPRGNAHRSYTVINGMLQFAVQDGLRPPIELKVALPEKVMYRRPIWETFDLDEYEQGLDALGRNSLAGIVVTAMELAQRVGDVREFRMGVHYWPDGWFRFEQSKTKEYVSFPAPPRVSARLGRLTLTAGDPLFPNPKTGEPFTNNQLVDAFGYARGRLLEQGLVRNNRMLQTLRHSGVVQLARSGCTLAEIGSLTGHSFISIEEMMEIYMRRDSVCASNAIAKREAWRARGETIDVPGVFIRPDPRLLPPPEGATLH